MASEKIFLLLGTTVEVQDWLLQGEVQVGIGIADSNTHPAIESVHMYYDHLVVGVPIGHEFAHRGRVEVGEIASQPLILYYQQGRTQMAIVDRACKDANTAPLVRMIVNSVEVAKRLVERGLGIGFFPMGAIRDELNAQKMAAVSVDGVEVPPMRVVAMVKHGQRRTPTVQRFLVLLKQIPEG
jgi:DNA-binding transcriptional LysR family regulator